MTDCWKDDCMHDVLEWLFPHFDWFLTKIDNQLVGFVVLQFRFGNGLNKLGLQEGSAELVPVRAK